MSEKEYKVGEVFKHTDGKFYQCVEDAYCGDCAFLGDAECLALPCVSSDRKDGCNVKYIPVTRPVEGMLYRAENGRLCELKKGSHWDNRCICECDPELCCSVLDMAVFGGADLDWYWAPAEEEEEEDAPASDESSKPVESPKHHIELSVVTAKDDEVTFKIADQTHRNDEFSQLANNDDEFGASNGITMVSSAYPYWDRSNSTLFCRGRRADRDEIMITCTAKEFARICEVVAEYNATDGKPRWPQYGDQYFYITLFGAVDSHEYDGHTVDYKLREFGNFFRTKEEAVVAAEAIGQVLKECNDH